MRAKCSDKDRKDNATPQRIYGGKSGHRRKFHLIHPTDFIHGQEHEQPQHPTGDAA